METYVYYFRRRCVAIVAGLASVLAAGQCWAVISYQLPQVQVTANPSGPTTGTFNVTVSAAPADLPKAIGAFNLDFSVGSSLVTLSPPSAAVTSFIPTVNPLLSDPGPPASPFIVNQSPNLQNLRVGHDVPTDQPLMDGKNLVTVRFTVPAGTTGNFPLSFGPNNELVAGTATQLPINLTDVGQITILPQMPVGVPGDYNSNGVVDAADYVVWRKRLGTATTLPNEVAGVTPGSVTNDDYNAWRARFGNTSGSGAALGAAAAVPEPSAWAMAGLTVAVLLAAARTAVRRVAIRPAYAVVAKRPTTRLAAGARSDRRGEAN